MSVRTGPIEAANNTVIGPRTKPLDNTGKCALIVKYFGFDNTGGEKKKTAYYI